MSLKNNVMQWRRDNFFLTDDLSRFDMDFIVAALQSTYWASDRSREIIEQSFRNSISFGLFDGAKQIGVSRVVTDRVTFSWLCDVVIDPAYRGRGLATWMIECVIAHPDVAQTKITLRTKDAHALYEKFGFARLEYMRRVSASISTPDAR